MSIITDFKISTSDFALSETLEAVPEVTLEFERCVTHSQEWIMPYVWVSGSDADRAIFAERVNDDSTVAKAVIVDEFDSTELYQIQWEESVKNLVNVIFDRSGVLIKGNASQGIWSLQARFGQHEDIPSLGAYFDATDSKFQLESIYREKEVQRQDSNITPHQQQALITAVKHGYYAIPRETTQGTLAAELEISENALSERLRRGTEQLVKSTMVINEQWEEEE